MMIGTFIKHILLPSIAFALCSCQLVPAVEEDTETTSVLVFHKTTEFRHKSIDAGIAALETMASASSFEVVVEDDASVFSEKGLATFDVILFLNTTGDILDDTQQVEMEKFIRNGGGFVGVHAAADTEWRGDWVWYRKLVGAVFQSHPKKPNVQTGRLTVVEKDHLSTGKLPENHSRADEWYNFRDYYGQQTPLILIDENSYNGGENGEFHPISWCHEYDGGRAFYTAMGHTEASYSDVYFLDHLLGGIRYAIGRDRPENDR